MTSHAHSAPPAGKPGDGELDVFGLTHIGKARRENQDHFLIASIHKQTHLVQTSLPDAHRLPLDQERLALLAMVADGVGSGEGELASRAALERGMLYVAHTLSCYYGGDAHAEAFTSTLQEAVQVCHEAVLKRAEAEATTGHAATTLTLWIGVWPWIYVVQVGDSRYYLYREGRLRQITRDQTVAQDLFDAGVLTRSGVFASPFAHVLSSAVGGKTAIPAPVVSRLPAEGGVHLLCSDGLTKHVSDDAIAERLRTMTSAKQVCEALLKDALDGGGTDNITVVVGRRRPPR